MCWTRFGVSSARNERTGVRLSISNLAWAPERDEEVAVLLRRLGVGGVELAPTKVWPRPVEASAREVRDYRRFWESRGIRIVALQALLFGRPDLLLFGSAEGRRDLADYLAGLVRLAAALGAGVLVFGSPKNRQAGSLPAADAERVAIDFFRRVGAVARGAGTAVCLEANPEAYGCDFITRAAQAGRLVEAVGEPGFGLHLDAGGMALCGEPPGPVLRRFGHLTRHFHVSEPHLTVVGEGGADHAAFANALRSVPYAGWVSIEMKQPDDADVLGRLEEALHFTRRAYGDRSGHRRGREP